MRPDPTAPPLSACVEAADHLPSLSPLFHLQRDGAVTAANEAARHFCALQGQGPWPTLEALLGPRLLLAKARAELRRHLAHGMTAPLRLELRTEGGEEMAMQLRQQRLPTGGMLVQLDPLPATLGSESAGAEAGGSILDLLGTTMGDLEFPLGALRWLAELGPAAIEQELARPEEFRRHLRPVQKAARHLVDLFDNLKLPEDLAHQGVDLEVMRVMAIGSTPARAAHWIDRLRREGVRLLFRAGGNAQEAFHAAQAREIDALLIDRHLPPAEAEALRQRLDQASLKLPLVFVQEDAAAMARELRQAVRAQGVVGARDQVWRRLEELALRDSLTGALNRRAFERFATQEFGRAQRYDFPLSLAFFDLDHFKEVNDQLGHASGDRLLQVFASYLQTATRQSDLVARLGGDEFAVLMSHTDGAGALILTQRLRDAVEQHLRGVLPMMEPAPGVSVGLAVFPSSGIDDFPALLEAADRALYRAKASGRGQLQAE